MKRIGLALGLGVLALTVGTSDAYAQTGGRPGPGGRPGSGGQAGPGGGRQAGPGGRRGKRKPPRAGAVMKRLDTNGDGVIDATEAANHPRVLQADADGDGQVTIDELRAHSSTKAFERHDKNGDGALDANEIKDAARFAALDADGDGSVTKAEWDAFHQAKWAAAQAAKAAFQAADANADGKLEASEWPATAGAAFADVDADGNGEVSPREVAEYARQHGGTSPL